MKVIADNLITAVSASSSNANYPSSNLLDEYPGFLWKANAAGPATLTFTVDGTSSGLALFNTNATNASFIVYDPNQVDWEAGVDWETGTEWASIGAVDVTQILDLDGVSGGCMVQWGEVTGTITVVISLTNEDGDVIQAGTAVGGKVLSYAGPSYGLTESIKDLSFVDEYNAGGVFIKDRDVLRVFDCQHRLTRDDAFHDFIYSVKKIIKKHPAAWLVTDLDNSRWLVYARFTKDPEGRHDTPTYSLLSYELTEVR